MCWPFKKEDKKIETRRQTILSPVPLSVKEGIPFRYKYPPEIVEITGLEYHKGQDYLAPIETPCFASGGEIVNVYDDVKWFGLYVVEKTYVNGVSVYLYFAHLKKALVRIGEETKRGQTICLTGASGSATRMEGGKLITHPHLHFETRKGGRAASLAVDPKTLM